MNDLRFDRFRPDQPLSDDDFDSIRRRVLDEVRGRGARPVGWFRPAIAAAVAVSLVMFAFLLMRPRGGAPVAVVPPKPATVAPSAPLTTAGGPSPRSAASARPTAPAASPAQDDTVAKVARKRHSRPAPETLVASAPQEPVVMQLQTSNPDIRIIWISR